MSPSANNHNSTESMQVVPERYSGPRRRETPCDPTFVSDDIFSTHNLSQSAQIVSSTFNRSKSPQPPVHILRRMPSPRTSPALRPTSPLSPGYKGASQFEALRPPSPRGMQSRSSGQRRSQPSSLQLPPLPRFHPANFPSSHSSMQSTPDATSPMQVPVSPRTFNQRNDLKKQMYLTQRELMSAALRVTSPGQMSEPVRPRLGPAGSPGPVTPLELEEGDGYLVAGIRHATNTTDVPVELIESFIQGEAQRQQAAYQQPESSNTEATKFA